MEIYILFEASQLHHIRNATWSGLASEIRLRPILSDDASPVWIQRFGPFAICRVQLDRTKPLYRDLPDPRISFGVENTPARPNCMLQRDWTLRCLVVANHFREGIRIRTRISELQLRLEDKRT
ncbi:hypothetical protein LIA77_11746 [Sarocladium implicatum]|nr:hypothetical protein LIA77_11746 [Sarocladium implicatum]